MLLAKIDGAKLLFTIQSSASLSLPSNIGLKNLIPSFPHPGLSYPAIQEPQRVRNAL